MVRILKDLEDSIESRYVLLVEDIIDTGLTLNYLLENLRHRNAATVRVCALLDKPCRRRVPVRVDYRGFEVPDAFVVGYGLDYDQRYRGLPFVGILKPEIYAAHCTTPVPDVSGGPLRFDLREPREISRAFEMARPECVFHTAALTKPTFRFDAVLWM